MIRYYSSICILILFNFIFSGFIYAQQDSISYKLKIISTATNDSVKSVLYNQLADEAATLKQIDNQERYADSAFFYAKKATNTSLLFRSISLKINYSDINQDTTKILQLINEGLKIKRLDYSFSDQDPNFLRFKIQEIKYKVRLGKISSLDGIKAYKKAYESIKETTNYSIITDILGKLSLLHARRKELGQSLNYNLLEQNFAEKSNNKKGVASARITELEISHQLLPKPAKVEDAYSLIIKAKEAEDYMIKNQILDILPFARLYLAKFYIHANNYNKADEILQSISDTSELRIIFSKYEQLCEIAKLTNDLKRYREYTLKFKPLAYNTKRPFVALNVHNYLVDYFEKTQEKDSANYYAKKLEANLKEVDTTLFLDYLYFSYDVLSRHYKGIENTKSLHYQYYANNVNKQLVINQKQAFVNIIKYKDELKNLQDKNSDLTSSISFFRKNLLSITILSLILLFLVFYFFKQYKKSTKSNLRIEKEKNDIIKKVEREHVVLNNKQKIYLEHIKYIKSDRNYIEVYYNNKKVIDRNHLKNILIELPPNFIQIHRSYIVNKNFIKIINPNHIVLESNIEIPISRTFKKNL